MKKFLALLLAVVMIASLSVCAFAAPSSLTVADGTGSTSYFPVYTGYKYSYSELIYPAELLKDMNGCIITDLTFYLKENRLTDTVYNVYLWESEKNCFNSQSDFTAVEDLTKVGAIRVATGSFKANLANEGSEVTFHFDTPFHYQGSNLTLKLVVVDENDNANSTPTGAKFYSNSIGSDNLQALNCYSDEQKTGTEARDKSQYLPKTTFTYEPAPEEEEEVVLVKDSIDGSEVNFGAAATEEAKTEDGKANVGTGSSVAPVIALSSLVVLAGAAVVASKKSK